jgi:hypothetical protein
MTTIKDMVRTRYFPYILLLVLLFVWVAGHTTSLFAVESPMQGGLTRPGDPCRIEALPTWVPQERWVWERLCIGEVADFNAMEGY